MMFDVERVRKDFPMLQKTMHGKPLVYLDSAATSQKPQQMIDTLNDFYSNHYATVHRAIYDLSVYATHGYHQARLKAQELLHAALQEEIIFTRGTTESINLVAQSFCKAFVQSGDEILITEMEHHSNIVPWQMAAENFKAILKVVPLLESGDLNLEALKSMLSERTKIVAVTHISNVLGTINPIKTIADMVHTSKAALLVDGAQAAPHLKIDVQALDCDFYVFSGHKLFGPNGIGVLYGKKELLEKMPPYQGGGDMIQQVTFEKTTYNTLPLKFEAGTPIIAEAVALGSAIDYFTSIHTSDMQAHEQALLHRAEEGLRKIPHLHIVGQPEKRGSLLCFHVDGVHPLDMGTLLDLKGIAIRTGHHCAQPLLQKLKLTACARASFAFYNTLDEIDYFLDSLKEVIVTLKSSV
jgi:cysteine desulfurase/selenocysteine lyase